MTADSVINVNVYRNDTILKNITQQVHLNNKNWTDYMKSLKTIQQNVNIYLTELVEQEKSAGESANEEEECDDSDDDDDECEVVKRKLESSDNKSGKKRKLI